MTGLIIILAVVIVCLIVLVIVYYLSLKEAEKEVMRFCKLYDLAVNDSSADHTYVRIAYRSLVDTINKKKVTKAEMGQAMQEAIGCLEIVLNDDDWEDEEDDA